MMSATSIFSFQSLLHPLPLLPPLLLLREVEAPKGYRTILAPWRYFFFLIERNKPSNSFPRLFAKMIFRCTCIIKINMAYIFSFFFSWNRTSCNSGLPQTHYIARIPWTSDLSASTFWTLELQVCTSALILFYAGDWTQGLWLHHILRSNFCLVFFFTKLSREVH